MRKDGNTVKEDSGAIEMTASSLSLKIMAVTEARLYLKDGEFRKSVIVTDSICTLQKIKKEAV